MMVMMMTVMMVMHIVLILSHRVLRVHTTKSNPIDDENSIWGYN